MRKELPAVCSVWMIDSIPDFVRVVDFECAAGLLAGHRSATCVVMETVRKFRRMRVAIEVASRSGVQAALNIIEPTQPTLSPDYSIPMLCALARLAYGELIEAFAAYSSLKICGIRESPTSKTDRAVLGRIFNDSYLAALWTSAHAEYVVMASDIASMSEDAALNIPAPDVYYCVSMSSAIDLTSLFDRRNCNDKTGLSASALSMLSILSRCTNAGSRGWESTLSSALGSSEGVSKFCAHAFVSCLSGMTPLIHPACRCSWRHRLSIRQICKPLFTATDMKEVARTASLQIKESIRAYLCVMLAMDDASKQAYIVSSHSTSNLSCPPLQLPHPSLQAMMHCLMTAGKELIGCSNTGSATSCISACVAKFSTIESRIRKKSGVRMVRSNRGTIHSITYCPTWLGGRSTQSCAPESLRLSEVVSFISASAFRARFVPLWIHARRHRKRSSRLDELQYEVIHAQNPVHRICALLNAESSLRVQRLAFRTPGAYLLTLGEAFDLLGIASPSPASRSSPSSSCTSDTRAVEEEEDDDLSASLCSGYHKALVESEALFCLLDAESAARLLFFSRCASLRDQLLSYDLGSATRRKQLRALSRRLMIDVADDGDLEAIVSSMPYHATHIFACPECRRVCNACQDNTGKDVPFNQLGVSSSMLKTEFESFHLRCAKRSSAAVKTAVCLEATAEEDAVEMLGIDPSSTSDVCGGNAVNHFRRDLKGCIEQKKKATSCGDLPLIQIPILGIAVRVFGAWYGLCSYCGVLTKIVHSSFYESEPCCGRCDAKMLLHGKESSLDVCTPCASSSPLTCRFCGRPEPSTATSKWKVVCAPADEGGKNAHIPPPLRKCAYCPAHWRPWLSTAHKNMPTPAIFAHITAKARPVFGAQMGRRSFEESELSTRLSAGFVQQSSNAKKRMRRLKTKASLSTTR